MRYEQLEGGEIVERIPHRDLRNKSAEILRKVAAGESFEITNHGDVVAMLVPPGLRPLKVTPATRRGGWSELVLHKTNGPSSQEILDELREDIV